MFFDDNNILMQSNTSVIFYERRYVFILTGFDIDTPDDFGRTCLHAAAAGGYVNSVFISFIRSVLDYTLSIPSIWVHSRDLERQLPVMKAIYLSVSLY